MSVGRNAKQDIVFLKSFYRDLQSLMVTCEQQWGTAMEATSEQSDWGAQQFAQKTPPLGSGQRGTQLHMH